MYDPLNPSDVKMTQFDERFFEQVIVDELFYMTDNVSDVNSHRKINEQEAMNIKSRQMIQLSPKQKVYVKN